MNEKELTRRLGLLTDDPVEPPEDLRRDLWHRIESQLRNRPVTQAQDQHLADTSDDGEITARPGLGRRRRLAGPAAAAAAFLAVIAVGILVWWLRPVDPREQVVATTTSPTATTVEESTGSQQIVIGADGTMAFPEDLFPTNIADAGEFVVVIAERSPHEEATPPQEEAAILAIDSGSGQVRWQRDLGGGPSIVDASEEAAWVAHFRTGAVTKLDLKTGEVLATATPELPFDFGNASDSRDFIPNDLEVAFGSLWMSTARGAVAEIDLDSGEIVRVTGLYVGDNPTSPSGLAASDDRLWVGIEAGGVLRLDPGDHSTDLIGLSALDHSGSSLVFHNGIMFVGGNRLLRDADGGFAVSDGSFTLAADSQVTALDPETGDWLETAPIPSSNAAVIVVGDQLFVMGDLNALWPIDGEHVIAGPPIRLEGLETMYVGDTGETMWLVDAAARALRPATLEDVISATISTTPGGEGPVVAWQHSGIGMIDSFLATSGRIVLADEDQVYVADGFGGREGGRNVAALSASAGEVAWTRDDLADGDDVFLQALIGDTLIVSGQYDIVRAVDTASGDVRWTHLLPDGYGAVGSVYADETLIVTVEAATEGDTRPPLVYGLDLAAGSQRWLTSLTEGTDLQWHSPATANGVVLVSSTLSHPASAPGNVVHALDTGTGEILWTTDLGGDQGFHHSPTLIHEGSVFLAGPDGTVALDFSDGTELWRSDGIWPVALTPAGGVVATVGDVYATERGGILLLDPVTGAETILVDAGLVIETPAGAIVQNGELITMSRSGLNGFDLANGTLLWTWSPTSPIVDLAAITSGYAAVPTADRSVVVVTLP